MQWEESIATVLDMDKRWKTTCRNGEVDKGKTNWGNWWGKLRVRTVYMWLAKDAIGSLIIKS